MKKNKLDVLKIFLRFFLKTVKIFIFTVGCIGVLLCILAFTSAPYWTRYWLGSHDSEFYFTPDYVVMLGGSGMPSEDNLMNLYFTASMAEKFTNSKIIIVHPLDSMVYLKMKKELMDKKIDTSRISFEFHGTNTRAQAMSLATYFPETVTSKVVIITSPEHVLRSVLAFRKLGFKNVGGCQALESDMKIDLSFEGEKLGGRKYVPDVGSNISMRYNFWNYLKLEIICIREFVALAYYGLKGWI